MSTSLWQMKQHQLSFALCLTLCGLESCAPVPLVNDAPSNVPEAQPKPSGTDPKQENGTPQKARTARLLDRDRAGRAAEILDESGAVIETLVPESFAQVLLVPDIANNSSNMISLRVPGTDIVAVSVEPETGRILLAVRGFIYAEVSTDLVFLLEPKEPGEAPRTASTYVPVYFDGPSRAGQNEASRPHFDVTQVTFLEGGQLQIDTSDASGGSSELVYDAARMPQSCKWSGGESRRCPRGIDPQ